MAKKVVNIVQDIAQPIERDVLAQAIVKMSNAAQALAKSGLNRKALVVLVAHQAKLPARDVSLVLDSLETLTVAYTR